MSALNWVRLDANFATNHKVLALMGTKAGEHALLVYVFSLGYCGSHGHDGFIPRAALGTFHGNARDAALLCDVGMWDEIAGGWNVHDWDEYQPTSEEVKARSQRARAAAEKRWGKSA